MQFERLTDHQLTALIHFAAHPEGTTAHTMRVTTGTMSPRSAYDVSTRLLEYGLVQSTVVNRTPHQISTVYTIAPEHLDTIQKTIQEQQKDR